MVVAEIGRRLNVHVAQQQARYGDGAQWSSVSGSGELAIGISGLARKFWMMTS